MLNKISQFIAISAFGLLILTSPALAADISSYSVLNAVNNERAILDEQPLTLNDTLNAAAYNKAQAIVKDRIFAHNLPGQLFYSFVDTTDYKYNVLGENLAIDFTDTSSAIKAWMNSPLHKKNIVDARYTETGIAVMPVTLGGDQTILIVQIFAQPKTNIIPIFATTLNSKDVRVNMNSTTATLGSSLVGISLIMGLVMYEYSHKKRFVSNK